MQVGDFYASKCPGGYLVLEVITCGMFQITQGPRTIGMLSRRDSAIEAVLEMARLKETDAWVSDDVEGDEQSVARHRPSHKVDDMAKPALSE